jgi:hypothetical protein
LTSPLVTGAAATKTARRNGETVAVLRKDHLCAALDARLGFTDVCGLDALTNATTPTGATIAEIVSGLPSDAYGRGAVAPILPNEPNLFFRAGIENICESVAALVIDAGDNSPAGGEAGVKRWSSKEADGAIADFVRFVMGLPPSDSRAAPAAALLRSHFQSALKQPGATETDALRSTFVVACLSPTAISIGL